MVPLINKELDLRGFSDPIPIVSINRVISELDNGDVLLVTTTDSGSLKDFDVWCEQTGNRLLQSSEQDDEYTFLICKHPELYRDQEVPATLAGTAGTLLKAG